MPAPVISASSSILGFRRNETFEFQPAATNAPTTWAAVGLPSGVTINTTTGKISGAGGIAGVYVLTVSATNADGTGTREFVLGISPEIAPDASSASLDALIVEIVMPENTVRLPEGSQSSATDALFTLKGGDVRLLKVRFVGADGTRVDPDPDTLRFALKQFEPDPKIVLAEQFEKTGSGATAEFLIPVNLTPSSVAAALSENETDFDTSLEALAELEWTREITFASNPLELRASTPTFRIFLQRDLVENA